MAKLTLQLNINSATDLENVNHITKMNVYAVTTIHGDKTLKNHKAKTPVDRSGGSNPTWSHTVEYSVNERLVLESRSILVLKLFSHRLLGDKEVGRVNVPLLDLLRSQTPSNNSQGMRFVTYQVRTPSDKMKGSLAFSYRFNGAPVNSGQAYQQMPMWPHQPSQQGYGYGPHGNMAPPPPRPPHPGYGYGGPSTQQPSRNEARLENGDTFVSLLSLI